MMFKNAIIAAAAALALMPDTGYTKVDKSKIKKKIELAQDIEVKQDSQVLGKWFDFQRTVPVVLCQKVQADYDDATLDNYFLHYYRRNSKRLASFKPLLQQIVGSDVNLETSTALSDKARKTLRTLHTWADSDIPRLLGYIEKHYSLNEKELKKEEKAAVTTTINKYKTLFILLLGVEDAELTYNILFNFAGRLMLACFDPAYKLHKDFTRYTTNLTLHPMARLCYSITWYYLVSEGWKDWSAESLKSLSHLSAQGKEMVYYAGGNDLAALLKHKVYTVTIIDPQLPTQDPFYAAGWQWLVKNKRKGNGIGDRVMLSTIDDDLYLQRMSYQEHGKFEATLCTGKVVTLPKSTTVWQVRSKASTKVLGIITFHRRFCEQQDFDLKARQIPLASFNEMYFIAAPKWIGGWGIDVSQFSPSFAFYVKQLPYRATKRLLKSFSQGDKDDFSFIVLGSDAT